MRTVLFGAGRALRETGQALDRAGSSLMGNYAFKEQLSRHRRIMPLGDQRPSVDASAFVAPNAAVIGQVAVGPRASVWYGAVVRADAGEVHVGADSSVGDRCVLHCTSAAQALRIGARASVGAGATLTGAVTVHDESVIGARAVLNGPCTVERNAVVAPGSVVAPGTTVASGQMWSGNPAVMDRQLTKEEVASLVVLASSTRDLATKHAAEHDKSEGMRQEDRDRKEFEMPPMSVHRETPF